MTHSKGMLPFDHAQGRLAQHDKVEVPDMSGQRRSMPNLGMEPELGLRNDLIRNMRTHIP